MNFEAKRLVTLKQFSECFDVVLNDCDFFCAAKVGSQIEKRVVYVQSAKYLTQAIEKPGVVGVIVPHDMASSVPEHLGCVLASDPVASFWQLHHLLINLENHYWENFNTVIPSTCVIHPTAVIAPKNVVLGERVEVGANAVIDERTVIGDDVFIGPLTHVGASAYELYEKNGCNVIPKQAGGVLIGDNTTLLSSVAVVKSCFPTFTDIGHNVNVDNLVHIAHDCKLGSRSKITAGSVLCGRVSIGEQAYIGPNATISNGISINRKGRVTLGSVVTRDVSEGQTVSGNFAREHRVFLKSLVAK